MSGGLTIPADILQRAASWAFQQALESVDVEAATLVTAIEAAKMMKISPRSFRKIAPAHIDLGEKLYRWSVKDIRHLIESRRVKSANRS